MDNNVNIKNVWDKVTVWCLNHDKPKEMNILRNDEMIKTPFYACKNYAGMNKDDPEPCYNRLNLDDYQGIMFKILEKIEEDPFGNNLTNYSFNFKGKVQKIFVRILKYSDEEIKIGILNKTVLGA